MPQLRQDVRVHHAGAEDFHPSITRADFDRFAFLVYFTSISALGSVNGKKCGRKRASTFVDFEEGFDEIDQATFEVAHMNAFFDHQAFDLVEHGRVRRIPIVAIDAARRENADRRLLAGHGSDLNRRRMRAQHFRIAAFRRFHEERVVGFAGRVTFREVQRGEIVPVIFNVRAFRDGKAHIAKIAATSSKTCITGCSAPTCSGFGRQRHVELFGRQLRFQRGIFQRRLCALQRRRRRGSSAR